jgi:hypothetical protein
MTGKSAGFSALRIRPIQCSLTISIRESGRRLTSSDAAEIQAPRGSDRIDEILFLGLSVPGS